MTTSNLSGRKTTKKTATRTTKTKKIEDMKAPKHAMSSTKTLRVRSVTPTSESTTDVQDSKATKPKKNKLIRDSFTIPKAEYEVIQSLKLRANDLGHSVKKSELLRAGIKQLALLKDVAFKAALNQVPVIKTGRPKNAR